MRTFFKKKANVILVALFCLQLFTRFYQLEERAAFGYDQTDNAWAAERILWEHKYPLLGMVGKLNSGLFIGPLYYYAITPVYFLTHLDPIASPLIAVFSSIISFFVLYLVSKKIFGEHVALLATGIYVFSSYVIHADKIQWPVNFIPPISFLIFYALYKIINGESKYILYLAFFTGLAFHIHLTAIFFPIIIFLSLPLFPRKRETFIHLLKAIPIFLIFMIPHLIFYLFFNHASGNFLGSSYHGFHVTRMLQIIHDAFIEFEYIVGIPLLREAVFFYAPIFMLFYARAHKQWQTIRMGYLIFLWIVIPWLVFTTYAGEITNYYFSSLRFIAISMFAYSFIWLWERRVRTVRLLVIGILGYVAFANITHFLKPDPNGFLVNKQIVKKSINEARYIPYGNNTADSYMYYIYMHNDRHEQLKDYFDKK